MINSVSISISDDDDLSGRVRLPARPRRRRPSRNARSGSIWRALRVLIRWWPVLFLAASVFLFFKVSVRLKSPPDQHRAMPDAEAEGSIGNLNRLDRVTRVVHGVREPCLNILSREELRNLDFPSSGDPNSLAERIHYKSRERCPEEKATSVGRFNSFTGYPSLDDREESFKLKGAAGVYCGFYCEKGGYKISEEDKSYMKKCKAVVSTCAFGGGDDLYQPIGMTDNSLRNVISFSNSK